MKKQGKKRVWKVVGALLLSAVLALSAPISHLPTGLDVYAAEAQADENGFVIENGVLTKYTGTATEVEIPSSVTSIGEEAFRFCTDLTSIEIPSSVTSIGEEAFRFCTDLTSIEIPSSVTSIGDSVFIGCWRLTSIVVEKENEKYDSRNNCNAIIESSSNTLIAGCKNTTIPEGVTSIGEGAFSYCTDLMSIMIPPSVTSIGKEAFSGCRGLTSITIPPSVTSIGVQAFINCSGLTSIVVEEGNEKYDSRNNCNAIIESSSNTLIAGCENTTILSSVTSIGDWAFYGCSSLTSITIPPSVTSIGRWAFSDCSGLTSITIPPSVTSIEGGAFSYCSDLTSIVVEEGNTSYDSRNNCNAIIERSSNTLIEGCKNTVIPPSVTSIGNWAFYGCSSLTSITIPPSVTSIGYDAFFYCSGLTSITIPPSVTSIEDFAFSLCSGLTSVTIPPSVTSLGLYVFQECDKLTIYGEEGSSAQAYARENNIPFRPLGSQDIFTTEELEGLTEDNKTQDTVIETGDGLTFTFKQGTMDLVDGVDAYDFGAEITENYDSLPNPDFAEEEFAFRINFNHSGKLPGEAEITMPADSKWVGKKLYYYEIKEDGTYNYVCRSTVEEDGSYTVKQSHCSAYVATTKVPANLGNCDGNEGITSSDALAVLRHEVGIAQTNFDARFADCDGKEGITSSDALAILRYEVNVIDTLE